MLLVEQYGLRGYDSVHLAVALELQADRHATQLPPLIFVSTDIEQLRVAAGLGLPTDDPNTH